MKVNISYSNEKFKQAQELNTKTAYKKGNFDSVISYGPNDIDEKFYLENKEILDATRGAGYWLWKPYFIKKTLETLEYGDYLFYCDSGAYFTKSVDILIKSLEENNTDLLAFEIPLIEKQWTKRDCFILMGCDEHKYTDTNQRIATYMLIKKTDRMVKFVDEYLAYCTDKRILTDILNSEGEENYSEFIDHRHDQSVFSLLTKKYDIKGFKEPSQYGDRPWEYFKNNRLYNSKYYLNSNYSKILISYRQANPLKFTVKEKIKDLLQKLNLRII